MFDVGRSSFKPTPYAIKASCECLQNNLALKGVCPSLNPSDSAELVAGHQGREAKLLPLDGDLYTHLTQRVFW